MRHFRSILYAFVLGPAIWTLSAVGFTRDLTGRARGEGTVETMGGLLLLLLAGAAYAILLLPRLSPAGPVLAALVFLTAVVWVLIDPASFAGLWPAGVRKEGFDLTLPADGLATLLAVPLLCTALSARRWRARDNRATARIQPPFDGPVMHRHAGSDAIGLASGEATQVVASTTSQPDAQRAKINEPGVPDETSGERTQVIGVRGAELEGRTQVIPAYGPGAATHAADDREGVARPPSADRPRSTPVPSAAEGPHADLAAQDDRPIVAIPAQRGPDGDEPTTDLRSVAGEDRESTRPMTVGGFERPADEVAADSACRTGQTMQRRP